MDNTILFQQKFEDSDSITITHDLDRLDLAVRVIIDGALRSDLIYKTQFDLLDSMNKIDVFLKGACSGRVQVVKADVVNVNPIFSQVNNHDGKTVFDDYTLTVEDEILGVHTGVLMKDVIITIPDIATLPDRDWGNFFWSVYKVSGDPYKVKIVLEKPEQFFVVYSVQYLNKIGDGVQARMDRLYRQYWFVDCASKASRVRTTFVNITPTIESDILKCRGEVIDMGGNPTVDCQFRYREHEGDPWVQTDKVTVSESGDFNVDIPVSQSIYQTQMIVTDIADGVFYSIPLKAEEASDFYDSTEFAETDGVFRSWPLQEHATTDEDGVELIDDKTMSFFGGVTSGSDIVNGVTVYKRVMTGVGYGQGSVKIKKGRNYTFFFAFEYNETDGEHTIFSTGQNILSLGADGADFQLQVNGNIDTWVDAIPLNTGMHYFFVVVDFDMDKTYLYDVTQTTANQMVDIHDTPKSNGIFLRLGRGCSGDARHKDYEYIGDGSFRAATVYSEALSTTRMKDIVATFEKGGLLIDVT